MTDPLPGATDPPAPDLEAARATLLEEQHRLRTELDEAIESPGQMTYGSQAAAASHVFEQQRDLAMRDHARQQIELVDAALARLDGGTFGACLRCHRPIHAERLEALPWTPHCIDCARDIARGAR